jgi:hypothetical protein
MNQLITRNLTDEEIVVCHQISTDTRFKKFRDIVSSDLDEYRVLSDDEDGRESELMNKGARQYIKNLLERTDADHAEEIFKKIKDSL